MDIILLERVEHLGQMGDVVKVKTGYARNYLLPTRKALRATEQNRKVYEIERTHLEASNLERRKEAESVGAKVEGLTVTLVRQAGEGGQLYGSVSARDIADAIGTAGTTVTRSQISLDRPIKTLGIHSVRVSLHPEVAVTIKANVARTGEEAEIQAKTGRAVVGMDDEERQREEAKVTAENALEELFEKPLDDEDREAIAAVEGDQAVGAEEEESASGGAVETVDEDGDKPA